MLLASWASLFTVLATAGGGVSIYYLTKSSNSETFVTRKKEDNCSKPFVLKLDSGLSFETQTEQNAQELKNDYYSKIGGTITQKQECINKTNQAPAEVK